MATSDNLEELWTQYLACPACSGGLKVDGGGSTRHLECVQCASRYPVIDDIPSFVEVSASEQAAEIAQRDAEAQSYEGNFLAWETFLEVMPLLRDLRPKRTDVVLDVGAGTGRFVREYVRDVKLAVAIDHSRESLRHLRRVLSLATRPGETGRCIVVHGDACALPVRPGAFDAAVSIGMLQHLPGEDHRGRAVSGMARALRPGGRFILQARHWSRMHELNDRHRDNPVVRRVADLLIGNADGGLRLTRTAHHAGGSVLMYNITAEELRELADRAGLRLDRVVGRLLCAKGFHRLGVARPLLERALERTPLSLLAGQEIVAVGTAPG